MVPLESLSLVGQEVFDVSTASEYTLQIDPPSLNINPHVKQCVDTVQTILPGESIILKHLSKRGKGRGRGRRGEGRGEGEGEGEGGRGGANVNALNYTTHDCCTTCTVVLALVGHTVPIN